MNEELCVRSGMLVRDLIEKSRWDPGRGYSADKKPTISALLPTFRRASGGRFERAVRSVLNQTLSDLELIIVDDGSTDGTAAIIRRLMHEDDRISCIWHHDNLGLPAISEYEAFVRSRGEYIVFPFDDFEFALDAFERLVSAARNYPQFVIHGHAKMVVDQNTTVALGKDPRPHADLRCTNFVANSSFIIPRNVIEEVGLYCPHVAASRLCDWDLWLRILRTRFLKRVDIHVGIEYGVSMKDSLGNTHPMPSEAITELFRDLEDAALRPSAFADYDVWAFPASCSAHLATAILNARKYYAAKMWARELPIATATDIGPLVNPSRTVVGLIGPIDASMTIFFSTFANRHGGAVKYINNYGQSDSAVIAIGACDAVLLVRQLLDPFSSFVVSVAKAMGINCYYFTDDNFVVLAREGIVDAAYTNERVRQCLQGFKGVFVASESLRAYYDLHHLHHDVRVLNPAWDCELQCKLSRLNRPPAGPLRLGFIGGRFRTKSLETAVIPAMYTLSRTRAVELFVRSEVPRISIDNLNIFSVPETGSYEEFLANWCEFGIDVVVHPRGLIANTPYKTNHILLSAWYLGAIPIVDAEEAFTNLGLEHGVLKASEFGGWAGAILVAADPERRADLYQRLTRTVIELFDPERNDEVLRSVLAATPQDIISIVERTPLMIQPIGPLTPPTPPRVKRPVGQRILREIARFTRRHFSTLRTGDT